MNSTRRTQIEELFKDMDIDEKPTLDSPISTYHIPKETTQTILRFSPFTGETRKLCRSFGTISIYGSGKTNSEGKTTISMHKYSCDDASFFTFPVYFIATPKGMDPIFLTFSSRPKGNDVECIVYAWQSDGTFAANIQFNWHCSLGHHPEFD